MTRTAPAAEVVVELVPEPRSGHVARQATLELAGRMDHATMAKLRLLVTELVVAALGPAQTQPLRLVVRCADGIVRAELASAEEGLRLARAARPQSWGLFLVERLADRWGADASTLWFELDAGC